LKSAPHQAAAALAAKQPTIAVRDEILAFFARRLWRATTHPA